MEAHAASGGWPCLCTDEQQPVFRSQVHKTARYIRAQTGYTPRCLRPPYGGTNRLVSRRAAVLGKKIRVWTIDTRDWSRPGTSVILRRLGLRLHHDVLHLGASGIRELLMRKRRGRWLSAAVRPGCSEVSVRL